MKNLYSTLMQSSPSSEPHSSGHTHPLVLTLAASLLLGAAACGPKSNDVPIAVNNNTPAITAADPSEPGPTAEESGMVKTYPLAEPAQAPAISTKKDGPSAVVAAQAKAPETKTDPTKENALKQAVATKAKTEVKKQATPATKKTPRIQDKLVQRPFVRLNCKGIEASNDQKHWVPVTQQCSQPPSPEYGPDVTPSWLELDSTIRQNKRVILRHLTGSPQIGIVESVLATYNVKDQTLVFRNAPKRFPLRAAQIAAIINDQGSRNCRLPNSGAEPCLLFVGKKRYAIAIEEQVVGTQHVAQLYYSPIVSIENMSSFEALVAGQETPGRTQDGQYLFLELMNFAALKGLPSTAEPVVFY